MKLKSLLKNLKNNIGYKDVILELRIKNKLTKKELKILSTIRVLWTKIFQLNQPLPETINK